MSKAIAERSLGINKTTGLEEKVSVWQININAESERVQVGFRVDTISPTGVVVSKGDMQFFIRQNVPANTEGGEANMKFDDLRNSDIGKAIAEMIDNDLEEYPNF